MKFIHLSDLHIGKRVNEYSMIDDQKYILDQILKAIDCEKPDAVLIAGDVYDKSVPSAEAVKLFDEFLTSLSKMSLQVFVISGNHDSSERIAFGSSLMSGSGVHMSPVYDGTIEPHMLKDEFGEVDVYLLPFLKPVEVRSIFPDEEIATYTDAVRCSIMHMNVDVSRRNVILSHQFVTGAVTCDSETVSVGGTDNVDASVYDPFDYVALGHIHGPQYVSRETIRYCGTPLKYSFSEKEHVKSLTVVEMCEKGNVSIREVPLTPERDMREIRGDYLTLTSLDFYKGTNTKDYLRIVLTDEEEIPGVFGKLQTIYENIMKITYDNARSRAKVSFDGASEVERKSEIELFAEFFEERNGKTLSDDQLEYSEKLFEELKESR